MAGVTTAPSGPLAADLQAGRASGRRSSPRCRRSPSPPGRSTSARGSPTPTARPRCSTPPSTAIRAGVNQYPPGPGDPVLRQAIADHQRRFYGLEHDPDTEVLVTAGATEALAGALLGMLDTGDEVVVFEPMYDSYQACIALAGARAVPVLLRPGDDGRYRFDPDELRGAITPRTKLILLNTPHNPTGKVFDADELALDRRAGHRARPARGHRRGLRAPRVPRRRARPDGHAARDGRAHADDLVGRQDVQHDRLEDRLGRAGRRRSSPRPARPSSSSPTSTARPFQPAIAAGLDLGDDVLRRRRRRPRRPSATASSPGCAAAGFTTYRARGDVLHDRRHPPAASPTATAWRSAARCPQRCGVVAVPNEVFYARTEHGRHLVRFACCKRLDVLDEAVDRLADAGGGRTREHVARRRGPARHRLERPRRQLRAAGADGRRRRRRRRRAGAAAPRRSRPGSSSTTPTSASPRAARRRSSSPSRPREHGVWVGGSCPEIPADAAADDQRPYNTLRARRPGRHDAPLPQDPPVLLRRRGASTFRAGDRARHRRDRGPAGQPVRLLRPALRRRVLAAGAATPTSTSSRPTGRRSGALHWTGAAAGAGDREPGLRRRRQPGRRRAAASPTRATAGSSTRSASCWRRPRQHRDDPARRRLRRHACADPRPLPVPPGPPLTPAVPRRATRPVDAESPVGSNRAWSTAPDDRGPRAWSSASETSPPSTASTSRSRRGEAFGFLGPNGAGKSSTMRMIGCTSPVTDGDAARLRPRPGDRTAGRSGPGSASCRRPTSSTAS